MVDALFTTLVRIASSLLLGVELVVADLRTADLSPICRGVDVLFNLGGPVSHMDAEADPASDLRNKRSGSASLYRIRFESTHRTRLWCMHRHASFMAGHNDCLLTNLIE